VAVVPLNQASSRVQASDLKQIIYTPTLDSVEIVGWGIAKEAKSMEYGQVFELLPRWKIPSSSTNSSYHFLGRASFDFPPTPNFAQNSPDGTTVLMSKFLSPSLLLFCNEEGSVVLVEGSDGHVQWRVSVGDPGAAGPFACQAAVGEAGHWLALACAHNAPTPTKLWAAQLTQTQQQTPQIIHHILLTPHAVAAMAFTTTSSSITTKHLISKVKTTFVLELQHFFFQKIVGLKKRPNRGYSVLNNRPEEVTKI
jgi:hypothetical protein